MKDKKMSAIAATSLVAAAGVYGIAQLAGTTKTTQIQDRMPIVLGSLCVFTEEDFNRLLELKKESGRTLFTCVELASFKKNGGTFEYATELASLKDPNGDHFFTGYDIVAFKHVGGTPEYARKFVSAMNSDGRPFSGSQLAQFYKLGLSLDEIVTFTDTSKPNALLIYPAHDGEFGYENYGAFRTDFGLNLYQELQKAYDLKVNVSSVEDEVYDALDASKGFMFFMAVGHGTEKTLSLAENDLRTMEAGKDERYTLDTSDRELEQHLQNLDPHAIIFLYSCSTAKGGPGADNLANAFAGWAKERKIIAAQDILWTNKITNIHAYPFDVTLLDETGEKDITYKISISP